MRAVIAFAIFAVLASVYADNEELLKKGLYSDKYDHIDVAGILENDRLRQQYYNCFMDLGPCNTADMIFFKGNFPEAIATQCARCTEQQKQNFDKMAEWYTARHPEQWTLFIQKYLEKAKELNA